MPFRKSPNPGVSAPGSIFVVVLIFESLQYPGIRSSGELRVAGCRLVGAGCRLVGAGCRLLIELVIAVILVAVVELVAVELAGQVAVVEVLAQVLKVVTGRLEKPGVELSRRVGLVAKEVEHVAILNRAGPVVAKS